jgi:putative NIF3 family GTP cyclohydrolase 1 type 2
MTAQDIVTKIQQKLTTLNIAWRAQTVDTFKAGSPETEVKGIATTGMATFDLIKRAAAAGRNFVITHEPTFYNHTDVTTSLEADAVYQAKQAFIKANNMVVFRFHDHAHALRPDPLVVGSARMLGLTQYASPTEPRVYVIPQTTLGTFAEDIAKRLGGRAIRVVGNPDMPVRRIMIGPGYSLPALNESFDVAIGGENPESGGNAEYVIDAAAIGQQKGAILLGHMLSEDWGMREVADWLKTFLTDVPIEWISTGEPFSAGT